MSEIKTVVQWAPILWLVAAITFGVVEAASVQLLAVWFALGAVAAMIASLLGISLWGQFWIFLAVSILALAGTRPFVKKVLKLKKVRTNADSLVGRIGAVTVETGAAGDVGRAVVDGQDWSAVSEDGSPLQRGERVLVKSIEGVKLVVERIL